MINTSLIIMKRQVSKKVLTFEKALELVGLVTIIVLHGKWEMGRL